MYSVSETTGKSLAVVVKDGLLRLNLPRHGLRGQTYDGAANMAGANAGAQAIAPFTLAFGCSFSTPIPRLHLSVNLLESARGEISLQP